jgi:hypothetical protein
VATFRITDGQRRARLAARHHLARTAVDPLGAVRDLVAVHSSDPLTPPLAMWVRVQGFHVGALDDALYETRSLWRLHGMRRTLFVVPVDRAPIVQAAAGRDVATRERRRLTGWLAAVMPEESVAAWLAQVEAQVLDVLADGAERSTRDLTAAIPDLATEITVGSGKWTTRTPVSSRVLFLLAMDGRIVRTRPAGSWRSSQYRWAATTAWFDEPLRRRDPAAARVDLGRDYLATHGPATVADVRWWTGWTAAQTTAALRDIGVVTVELDGGVEGLDLPDDLDSEEPPPDHVAFLPALDPTTMGWKDRGWYLGPHAEQLFDRNGNAGPTVWSGGRVVGGWAQRPDGEVAVELLEPIDDETRSRIDAEASALTAWLDGVVAIPRFRTPLERRLSA